MIRTRVVEVTYSTDKQGEQRRYFHHKTETEEEAVQKTKDNLNKFPLGNVTEVKVCANAVPKQWDEKQ